MSEQIPAPITDTPTAADQPASENLLEVPSIPAADVGVAASSTDETTPLLAPKPVAPSLRRRTRRASNVVDAIADIVLPGNLATAAKKVGPILDAAAEVWSKAQPHMKKARVFVQKVYKKVKPYHPEEWIPMIVGLVLCFFGGSFATTIAAVEAFRLTSYSTVKDCLLVLYADQVNVTKAWETDDAVLAKDQDNNGIADGDELTDEELAKHKFLLVVRTVNPSEVGKALAGINTGFLAVLAALRVRFAQAVTIGAAIGVSLNNILAVKVIPSVEKTASPEFKKWIKPIFNYGTKMIGFTLAMLVWRSIMALHSATRGAQMACEGLICYLVRNKILDIPISKAGDFKTSKEFVYFSTALAAFGLFWQMRNGFAMPFPLNLLLLPFTMFEATLGYFVAV